MKRTAVLTLLTALLALWTMAVFGAVPQLINFQGILRDGSGNPVVNSSYSVVFSIYAGPTGGSALWTETKSVSTLSGLFNTLLGSVTPIPDTLFNDSSRYLGIKVGADPEMTPRQKMSSVGYSQRSSEWTSAAEDLFRLNGNVGIGTSAPTSKLDVQISGSSGGYLRAVYGTANNSSSGNAFGAYFGAGPGGTGNQYGVYGEANNSSFGDAYGGYFTSSSSSGVSRGIWADGGYEGVYANGGTYGVYSIGGGTGVIGSGGTDGIYGIGGAHGVYGFASGYPNYGVYGVSSSGGYGLKAESDYDAIWAAANGSTFVTYGCYADAENSSSGTAYGGVFYGYSTSGSGYGIYAAGGTYAGYFSGSLVGTGFKSAAVKTDNGEYHLMYAEEATENWFEDFGTAQVVNGRATVHFDPLFVQTVNTSIAYHVFLTPEGDSRGLYVANKTPNSFEIREQQNGKSDLTVSYRIVAKRKGYEDTRLAKMEGPNPEEVQAQAEKRRAEQAKLSARDAEIRKQVEAERSKVQQERVIQEQKIKEHK